MKLQDILYIFRIHAIQDGHLSLENIKIALFLSFFFFFPNVALKFGVVVFEIYWQQYSNGYTLYKVNV